MRELMNNEIRRAPSIIGPLCDYISGLPTTLNKETESRANEDSLTALHSSLGVSIDKPKISFSDNTWDFNHYFVSHNKSRIRLKFENLPATIRDSVKLFCVQRLISGIKVETVESDISKLTTFFSIFNKCFPTKDPYAITNKDIAYVFDQWETCKQRAKQLYSIYHLYSFISVKEEKTLAIDFKDLAKQLNGEWKKIRQATSYRKTPNIPEEYARKIERATLDTIRDIEAPFNMRMIAGYILLSMWTGLRTSELARIKSDALYTEKVNNGSDEAYFIYYSCSKKSKTNKQEYYQTTFCPELAVEAFKTLVELKKSNSYAANSEYLFCFLTPSGGLVEVPTCPSTFTQLTHKFFTSYLYEDATKEWEGIPKTCARHYDRAEKKRSSEKISVPTITQYRVRLCSYFYSHGVDLPFIEINMGHMSCDMAAYYYRKEDETHQKELKTAATFLKNIIANDYEPLGVNGHTIKKDIKSILARTNYDVYKNIEEMVAIIGKRYIIRAKLVGVCVKLAPTTCATDDVSDKMLCAYGYCKNILHFFYMLDLSYASFKALTQSYNANVEGNHINAAQHELKRIHTQIKMRLEPEIEQLEKELTLKGVEFIISEHPQLADIIKNLDSIKEEIKQWKKRKE